MLLNYWYLLVTLCVAGCALGDETVIKTVTAGNGKDNKASPTVITTTIISTKKPHRVKSGLRKASSKIDKFFDGDRVTVTKTLETSPTKGRKDKASSTSSSSKSTSTSSSSSSSSTSSKSTSSTTSKTTSSSTTSSSTTTSTTTSSKTSSPSTTTTTKKADPVKAALDWLTATTTTTTVNKGKDKSKATSTSKAAANRLKIGCW